MFYSWFVLNISFFKGIKTDEMVSNTDTYFKGKPV